MNHPTEAEPAKTLDRLVNSGWSKEFWAASDIFGSCRRGTSSRLVQKFQPKYEYFLLWALGLASPNQIK